MSDEKPKTKKDLKSADQNDEKEDKQPKQSVKQKQDESTSEQGKKSENEKSTPRNCMTLIPYVNKLRKLKYPMIKFGGGSKSYISELAINYAVKLKRAASIIARMNRRITILEKDVLSATKIIQSPFGFYDQKTFTQGTTPKYKRTNNKPRKAPKEKGTKNPGPKSGGVKKGAK